MQLSSEKLNEYISVTLKNARMSLGGDGITRRLTTRRKRERTHRLELDGDQRVG